MDDIKFAFPALEVFLEKGWGEYIGCDQRPLEGFVVSEDEKAGG